MVRHFYRPELDALRFFAFFCVFCSHISLSVRGWWRLRTAGASGLSLFFLLSAFLIVELMLQEKEATGTLHLRAFAARRILRIWPLYFSALFFYFMMGVAIPALAIPFHALLGFIFLLGNVWLGRHGWIHNPINPLWSISLEEQFYLLIPSLFFLGGRRLLLVVAPILVFVAYLVLCLLGRQGADPNLVVWSNSFVQFQFFAAGALIAILLHGRNWKLDRIWRALLFLAGLGLWQIAVGRFHIGLPPSSTAPQLLGAYACALSGTIAIFLSFLGIDVPIPAPLRYLGKISFGLYVFHSFWLWLIFESDPAHRLHLAAHQEVGALIALAATIATAAFSYQFFERPILRLKDRFAFIRTRAA